MELQRNILIVALLTVSFMLFLSWQEDYAEQPPAFSDSKPVLSVDSTNVASNGPVSQATINGDLSGLSAASTDKIVESSPQSSSSGSESSTLISVTTDVLTVKIDPLGGDIVDLRLPRYPLTQKTPDKPVQLLSSGSVLFVSQSGLFGPSGPDLADGTRAKYLADASEFFLADTTDTLEVVLHAPEKDGVTIDKVFRFNRGDYLISIEYRVRNAGTNSWSGFMFGQLKRDGSGDPSNPGGGNFLTTSPSGLGPVHSSREAVYNKTTLEDVMEQPLKHTMPGGWIGFIQHYFVSAWIPDQKLENELFTRRTGEGFYLFGFTTPRFDVAPGTSSSISASFYAGPKHQDYLKQLSPGLDLTADYGWFWFIAQPLLWVLVQIEELVGNWGLAIIFLTVLVKLAFYYPSKISYESMAHMRRVTPELTRIREEYKNDRQKQSQEMLALYRREKINPLGGCLPILLQMPVFIALYWVLLESVELRQAPFFFWINDLSVKDPYFILPVLMGISMYVQTRLNPPPPDPMQAKLLQWMPVVFTVFFLFFSSGLVLYWLVNNLLSIAQQWHITRKIERTHIKV